MTGMSRCFDGQEIKTGDLNPVAVRNRMNQIFRTGLQRSLESIHIGTVDPLRAGKQFLGIDQMTSPAFMDMDGYTKFRQSPGTASMIKMDVREQYTLQIRRRNAE